VEKKFYRINHFIKSPTLRVIGDDGKQIGILTISEALAKANEAQLDLVEIAPTAKPPVAKIIDYKKFVYLEEKRARKGKKSKGGEIKEVRFTPFIASADFDVRIKRAIKFLGEGDKVRIVVKFVGRQISKRDFGYEIVRKAKIALLTAGEFEGDPKWMGPNLIVTVTPIKKIENDKNETENQTVDRPSV
jgi:translation initiation factor IF-3